MKYINVVNKFKYNNLKFDLNPLIISQSDGVLISLKKDIEAKSIANGKIDLVPKKIAKFRDVYLSDSNQKMWVDSGGFNLFKYGDVSADLLEKYIDYYIYYLEKYQTGYDYIFSLDLPLATRKSNEWFNNRDTLKRWNYVSMEKTIKVLNKHPLLWEKFYFVYQFKTPELYKLWGEIYNELDLKNKVINRAIGGLVSIYSGSRKSTEKNYNQSAVIAPAYNALNDYVNGAKHFHDFRLHFLGLNLPYDRFIGILLEKLFSGYLKALKILKKSVFTYDTSHYTVASIKKIQKIGIFSFDPDKYENAIRLDNDIRFVSGRRLRNVYPDKSLHHIQDQINENLTWGELLEKPGGTNYFFPLFVYSNKNLDRYFEYVIDQKAILGLFEESNNVDHFKEHVDEIFNSIVPSKEILTKKFGDYMVEENKRTPLYDIFSSDLITKIKNSLDEIFSFHRWFMDMRDNEKELQKLVKKSIRKLGVRISS